MGNGGRPAPHHPIPGNIWTEGLSTADRLQKKKVQDLSGWMKWPHVVDRLCRSMKVTHTGAGSIRMDEMATCSCVDVCCIDACKSHTAAGFVTRMGEMATCGCVATCKSYTLLQDLLSGWVNKQYVVV